MKPLMEAPRRYANGELKKVLLRQGRCGNRWCQRPLVPRTLDGRLYFEPCEPCGRLAKGRCYDCNEPLRPIDKHGNGIPSRWHMRGPQGCYYKRIKFVRQASQRNYRARHGGSPDKELKRKAQKYVKERKDILAFNLRRRRAQGRERNFKGRTRPCPELGCKNLMTYTSRPPNRCDPCWERLAK